MKRYLGLALIVLSGLIMAACTGSNAFAPTASTSSAGEVSDEVLTQTKEEAAVTVRVTPLNLDAASAVTLDFEIALDTHSVDLAYDMLSVVTLRSDTGEEVQPTKWDGPAGGGHHLSGTLSFPQLKESGQAVTLILRGIAGVPERTFEWEVK